jgi:hypothetical protein
MSDALALPPATVRPSAPASSRPGPRDRHAEPPAPGRARATALRWPVLALGLFLGCGGTSEATLKPAENPPATAKERAQTNPRIKADLEANSKKAR